MESKVEILNQDDQNFIRKKLFSFKIGVFVFIVFILVNVWLIVFFAKEQNKALWYALFTILFIFIFVIYVFIKTIKWFSQALESNQKFIYTWRIQDLYHTWKWNYFIVCDGVRFYNQSLTKPDFAIWNLVIIEYLKVNNTVLKILRIRN